VRALAKREASRQVIDSAWNGLPPSISVAIRPTCGSSEVSDSWSPDGGQDEAVLIVRATRKLLHHVGRSTLADGDASTTLVGQWYATVLGWDPEVVLLVNEPTLIPVLMPLEPAAALTARIPSQLAAILSAHGAPAEVVDEELRRMGEWRVGPTANRSVVGIMNEFTVLADAWCDDPTRPDLPALAMRLARTPCGPLRRGHGFPDRELAALLETLTLAPSLDGDVTRPGPVWSDRR
jgi:hypothetical protein